jgi:hypothetical protein
MSDKAILRDSRKITVDIGVYQKAKTRLHSDSRRAFIRADRAAGWFLRLG